MLKGQNLAVKYIYILLEKLKTEITALKFDFSRKYQVPYKPQMDYASGRLQFSCQILKFKNGLNFYRTRTAKILSY